MADIVDPIVIRFCNEIIRPVAEELRAIKYRIDSAMVTWYGGMNTLVPNDSSPVADGREGEGVSRLTGIDVNGLVAQMAALKYQLEQSGVPQVISKPCVRTFP
jgi:hypothetical protein